MKSYLPIISFIIIEQNLNQQQIENFLQSIKEQNYIGRGYELSPNIISDRYKMLKKLL